jgi:hypothetical protein
MEAENLSGFARMTSRVCFPMEPVDPNKPILLKPCFSGDADKSLCEKSNSMSKIS